MPAFGAIHGPHLRFSVQGAEGRERRRCDPVPHRAGGERGNKTSDLARKPALLPLSPLQLLRSGERVALSVAKGRVRGRGKCATHSNLEGFQRWDNDRGHTFGFRGITIGGHTFGFRFKERGARKAKV